GTCGEISMTDKKDWNDILREQGPERAREIFEEAIKEAHDRERTGNGNGGATREDDDVYDGMFDDIDDDGGGNQRGGSGDSGTKAGLPPPPPPPPPASLPVIQCDEGELLDVIEQTERAILQAPEQRLFQRGGMLVRLKRIAQKTTIKGITRDAGSLIIAEATSECVCLEMARTAHYTKVRGKRIVPTRPPLKYARAIAAKNEFPFKTLLATIETPTLRADGSVLQERGYDEASGLYFDSTQTFPTIKDNRARPTRRLHCARSKKS